MHTRGYTGKKRTDGRGLFFSSNEDIARHMQKVENYAVMLSNPSSIPAFEFSHYIRCELFLFIDSLLTTNFTFKKSQGIEVEEKELRSILALCEIYCGFYCHWLANLPKVVSVVRTECKVVFGDYREEDAVFSLAKSGRSKRRTRIHQNDQAIPRSEYKDRVCIFCKGVDME
eukprot:TRINITY_DN1063_c0_g1_i10.p2 TRINITY_DN1063_c0_g1~~TRINITY_DN1063_c0_g1_i10.p2  ORF type:complete len:172 (-),score=30.76 TRINITY_DN1063_c0_g1_i10:330-845(-)